MPKGSGGSTTLSTRFDDREMAILKGAADQKQWSLAQLIRIGAYEKAVNILNSSGEAALAVRTVLNGVLRQLLEAEPMVWDSLRKTNNEAGLEILREDVALWNDPADLVATQLDPHTFEDFTKAIRSLGSEIAPMLVEERQRMQERQRVEASRRELIDKLMDPRGESPSGSRDVETSGLKETVGKGAADAGNRKRGKGKSVMRTRQV